MFIKNCPSAELAVTFRSKTIDKWTAHEVQDILDEYHFEMVSVNRAFKEKMSVNALTAVSPPAPPADGQRPLQLQATDPDALYHTFCMQKSSLASNSSVRGPTRRPGPKLPRIGGLHDKPCSFCQDAAHSAFIQCRDPKLCFNCHSPDHCRRDCPAFCQQSEN